MLQAETFSVVFLVVLVATLVLRVWLARRQVGWVRRHRETVPDAFSGEVSLEEHRKAADYTVSRTGFGIASMFWGAIILLGWTLGGGIQFMDTVWQTQVSGTLLAGLGVMLSVALISSVLDLPLTAWDHFVLEERFGFNNMTWKLFAADTLRQLLLSLLIMAPLAAGILWIMSATGVYWWLPAWLLWMGFTLAITWAYPRIIAPLFNKFEPLPDGDLRTRIEQLLERCGFTSKGLFVMDASKRSAHGNAYFTGLGRNKRIVLFDTIMKDLADNEVESVLAHELGHFRLRHVPRRLALMAVVSLLGLMLLAWLATQPWFYTGLGVESRGDHLAVLLFLLVAPVFTFLGTPLGSWYSRRHEFQADAYAAEHASATALGTALVALYRENATTLTPEPLYSRFYHSHPPALERISRLRDTVTSPADA